MNTALEQRTSSEPCMRSIDHELDAVLADPLGPARVPGVSTWSTSAIDDQASRLRAMLNSEVVSPTEGLSGPPEVLHPNGPRSSDVQATLSQALVSSRSAKVIAVTSGKGGVGKTTVSVNLASCLAQRGLRTVLVDADLGTANADILCGITPHARLEHVVTDLPVHDGARRTLADIAITAPGGFRLVPGSAGIARLADLTPFQQHCILEEFSEFEADSEAILVDTGAGVGRNVVGFVASADVALVVLTPEPTSLTDAYSLIKCLHRELVERFGSWTGVEEYGPRIAVVVNQAANPTEARQAFGRISAVCERFLAVKVYFGGCIAQDVRVAQSVRARQPVVIATPATEAAQDIRSLSAFLVRELGLTPVHVRSAAPRLSARPSLLRRWLGFASNA